jgi:hypothetical protein
LIVKIIHAFPSWYVILCMLTGLGYAAILYLKNRKEGFSNALLWVLATFRFLLVTIMAFLLLSPMLERIKREQEDPFLLFVQDNSSSVLMGGIDGFDPEVYLSGRDDFLARMSEHFDVRRYSFGESFMPETEVSFSERLTDMSAIFRGIDEGYSNRNLGAVIVAGDGIYNHGINPLYALPAEGFPVYTLALGDTLPRRDVMLQRVNHNRVTYLGNRFPLEVMTEATGSEGAVSVLSIVHENKTLFEQPIRFTSDHHVETIFIELEAESPGLQRYEAILSPLEGEVNLNNNRFHFYIDVIDSRQKVLLLAHSPHPDVAAIAQALESHQQYEVEVSLFRDFSGSFGAWNLIILHQLPAGSVGLDQLVMTARDAALPLLFVVGRQTDIGRLNQINAAMRIQLRSEEFTEALPAANEQFALFALQPSFLSLLNDMPPLFVPFASYEQLPLSDIMLRQKVGAVLTEQPLIAFSRSQESKTGMIMGEGIWRWRMNAYMRSGEHTSFNEIISSIAQYLALPEDTRPFRMHIPALVYEHETVLFDAELYNPSYELVNDPDVNLSIRNEEGDEWTFMMSRTANAYQLDAGSFAPGEYFVSAMTSLAGEDHSADGAFTVASLQFESIQTRANHQLLYQIADRTDALMVYPDQWDALQEHLLQRTDINPVMYSRRSFTELIDVKSLFFLIMLLIAAEWFLRKRNGSY